MLLAHCAFFISLFGLAAPTVQPAASAQPKSVTEQRMEQQGLVDITKVIPDIHVSLMYARADNFVGRVMYRDLHRAYLLPETAAALKKPKQPCKKRIPS